MPLHGCCSCHTRPVSLHASTTFKNVFALCCCSSLHRGRHSSLASVCANVCQVLYLTEPIDEVAIQNLAEYEDEKFVDVSREGIDLGTDDQDTKKVGTAWACLILLYCAFRSVSSSSPSMLMFPWHQPRGLGEGKGREGGYVLLEPYMT